MHGRLVTRSIEMKLFILVILRVGTDARASFLPNSASFAAIASRNAAVSLVTNLCSISLKRQTILKFLFSRWSSIRLVRADSLPSNA